MDFKLFLLPTIRYGWMYLIRKLMALADVYIESECIWYVFPYLCSVLMLSYKAICHVLIVCHAFIHTYNISLSPVFRLHIIPRIVSTPYWISPLVSTSQMWKKSYPNKPDIPPLHHPAQSIKIIIIIWCNNWMINLYIQNLHSRCYTLLLWHKCEVVIYYGFC